MSDQVEMQPQAPETPAASGQNGPPAQPAAAESQQPTTGAKPLPADPASIVESVLNRTKTAVWGSDEPGKLHDQISREVEDFRNRHAHPSVYCRNSDTATLTPEQRFWLALCSDHMESANPVWRYCLARRLEAWQIAEDLRQKACEAYVQKAEAYERVLADLILQELRDYRARQDYARGTNATTAADWAVYRRRLERRQGQPLLGFSTGLPSLDSALKGLRGLAFLGGCAGDGKTTLALTMAVAALRADPEAAVLFYSLDMTREVLYDRLLCHEAGSTYQDLMSKDTNSEVQKRLEDAHTRLLANVLTRLKFIERERVRDEKGMTEISLWRHRRELLVATGARRVFVVIDFFGKMDVKAPDQSPLEKDHRRLELLTAALDNSKSAGSPNSDSFLVISEVRKDKSSAGLTVDDLLGSSRLSYSPDTILLLEQDDHTARTTKGRVPMVINVAKGRDGTRRGRIPLLFDYEHYRYYEAAPKAPGNKPRERKPAPDGAPTSEAASPDSNSTPEVASSVDPMATGRKGSKADSE
jgi:replicative DNA helicase